MKLLKQIRLEMGNLLRSKFLLILGIVVLSFSLLIPIASAVIDKINEDRRQQQDGIVMYDGAVADTVYVGGSISVGKPVYSGESVTVDGITIPQTNPMYWNIESLLHEINNSYEYTNFQNPAANDLYTALLQQHLEHYINFAKHVSSYSDYRYSLAWQGEDKITQRFFYTYEGTDYDALHEVASWRIGLSSEAFYAKYVNVDAVEKLQIVDEIDAYLADLRTILEKSDFPLYVDLMIRAERDNIQNLQNDIRAQEELIIKNPAQEESIGRYIEELRARIKNIEEHVIPLWQLRLERNIIPNDGSWQNNAIDDIENYSNRLTYTVIETEENFRQDHWLVQQYKTYDKYVAAIQKQIDDCNNRILIAQRSLDDDRPDMRFVTKGARNKTVSFLSYSLAVAMFAAMVGGWMMANEFQTGTVRLLLIRPRTRTKILLSKYFAALGLCLAVFLGGCLLNLLANGFINGFADFAYPNYNVVGTVSFPLYYVPKLFACTATVIFAFSAAFMLSTVLRNSAISIALPIMGYAGSLFIMLIFEGGGNHWLAYTPFPYIDIAGFFISDSTVNYMISNGAPFNVYVGLLMLLGLSALFTLLAAVVFKKRDVTN